MLLFYENVTKLLPINFIGISPDSELFAKLGKFTNIFTQNNNLGPFWVKIIVTLWICSALQAVPAFSACLSRHLGRCELFSETRCRRAKWPARTPDQTNYKEKTHSEFIASQYTSSTHVEMCNMSEACMECLTYKCCKCLFSCQLLIDLKIQEGITHGIYAGSLCSTTYK